MSLYHLKMRLKRNKLIKGLYDRLIGDRKAQAAQKYKQNALATDGNTILEKVEAALDGTELKYFLTFGNLLGLVRDGSFMSYDCELDYAIEVGESFSWEELERLLAAQGLRKTHQFTIDGNIQEQTYRFGNLTVDFFGYHTVGDESIWNIFFRKDGYIYDTMYDVHIRESHFAAIGDVCKREYDGMQVTVLAEPEAFLASVYGEGWRVPDPNWVPVEGDKRIVLDKLAQKCVFE